MEKYSEDFKIRYSELDCNLVLKPSSLVQLLQDIASQDAENKGFGYSFLKKRNLGWFLLKYHLEFNNYPKGIYDLTLKTESRGYSKLFAFRDFEIYSKDELLGNATTTWGLIDLETKSMTSMIETFKDNKEITLFEKREDDLKYNKIPQLQNIDFEKEFSVRFDDLDVNRHVNNSNYITWAFEALNFDFRNSKKPKTLDIVFKKEAKFKDVISSQVQIAENTTLHIIKNKQTDEELCLIQAIWE